jgi:phosphoglycolate phosphatase-like HAD superfamily hydrolase
MTPISPAAQPLADLKPTSAFFVGIDSDGCAFDTMEVKHKECFIPNIIKYWDLQPVSKYTREAAEFVNLYSKWRGINRWPALVKVFDLLNERPDVLARKVKIPAALRVREFIASGRALSDSGLKAYMSEHQDPELDQAWAWTRAVNETIADLVHGVPPFPYVRESLGKMENKVDMVVVSATPTEALIREWQEHDIARYARIIAGQELGTKEVHLSLAAQGKYAQDHILMMGDAPGDMKAARSINALFFPINPGHEEQSWELFYNEGLDKFLNGEYAGEYEKKLIVEFEKVLPDLPPWKK